MIFSAFQKEDDDAVFTVVKNISNGVFAAGEVCVWDVESGSPDGVKVTVAASATLSLFRGICAEAIADEAYGKVQVGGYNSYAKVTNTTNQAVAAGNILIPVAAAKYLTYSAAGDGKSGFVYAAEAVATAATPASAAKKVLLRAL
jgi:hypothetical protein